MQRMTERDLNVAPSFSSGLADLQATQDTAAMREAAFGFETSGDLTSAKIWYRKAAELGEVRAMHDLASVLVLEDDLANAKEWLRMAAVNGFNPSRCELGDILEREGDHDGAAASFQAAAGDGYPEGLHRLGLLLFAQGREEEGIRLLEQAADRYWTPAMHDLGWWCAKRGDVRGAKHWYLKAAAEGHEPSMMALADVLDGVGHHSTAARWRRQASESRVG